MAGNVLQLREKGGESEKITINLGYVDLGRIDLLVQEGFYSNRTDFIRTAIRNQLSAQADAVTQSIVRHTLELGLRDYSRADLEAVRAARRETSHQGRRPCPHRLRRHARARFGDDRIDNRARCPAGQRRSESRHWPNAFTSLNSTRTNPMNHDFAAAMRRAARPHACLRSREGDAGHPGRSGRTTASGTLRRCTLCATCPSRRQHASDAPPCRSQTQRPPRHPVAPNPSTEPPDAIAGTLPAVGALQRVARIRRPLGDALAAPARRPAEDRRDRPAARHDCARTAENEPAAASS